MSTEPVLAERADRRDARPDAPARRQRVRSSSCRPRQSDCSALRVRRPSAAQADPAQPLSNAVKYNRIGGTRRRSPANGTQRHGCASTSPTPARASAPTTSALLFVAVRATRAPTAPTSRAAASAWRCRGGSPRRWAARCEVTSQPGVGSTFWVELPLVEGAVERYERLDALPPSLSSTNRSATRRPHGALHRGQPRQRHAPAASLRHTRRTSRSSPPCRDGSASNWPASTGPRSSCSTCTCRTSPATRSSSRCGTTRPPAIIPVVVVSADATSGQIQRLISAGAVGYLTKPFDVTQVRQLVNDAVAQRYAVQSATR